MQPTSLFRRWQWWDDWLWLHQVRARFPKGSIPHPAPVPTCATGHLFLPWKPVYMKVITLISKLFCKWKYMFICCTLFSFNASKWLFKTEPQHHSQHYNSPYRSPYISYISSVVIVSWILVNIILEHVLILWQIWCWSFYELYPDDCLHMSTKP